MDALLMCGGRGTRLDASVEKPLFEVGGRPMVDRVRAALEVSGVDTVHAVVSPHAPATRDHVDDPVVETPGDGYVADLDAALDRVDPPVLTVAADLPLLDVDPPLLAADPPLLDGVEVEQRSTSSRNVRSDNALDAVFDAHDGGSLAVHVPAELKRTLGVGVDATVERGGRELAPAGVNVVAESEDETMYVSHDPRLAVNVNRRSDAAVAEALL